MRFQCPSNIAEGHNRHARKAYLNHVNVALGSLAELDTQLEIAVRLEYLSEVQTSEVCERVARVGQMLRRLQQSLEADTLRTGMLSALFWVLAGTLLL